MCSSPAKVVIPSEPFKRLCRPLQTVNAQMRKVGELTVRIIAGADLEASKDRCFDLLHKNDMGVLLGITASPNAVRAPAAFSGLTIYVPSAQLTFDRRKHGRPVHHIVVGMFMLRPPPGELMRVAPDVYVAGWIGYEELDDRRVMHKPKGYGGPIRWPVKDLRPMAELDKLLARQT